MEDVDKWTIGEGERILTKEDSKEYEGRFWPLRGIDSSSDEETDDEEESDRELEEEPEKEEKAKVEGEMTETETEILQAECMNCGGLGEVKDAWRAVSPEYFKDGRLQGAGDKLSFKSQ